MDETTFEYSNLSGRSPGPFISTAGLFLRGVRQVQAQVEPYARAWKDHNRRALTADGPLWVALGDSMTQGIGASAFDRGWTTGVAADLPEHRLVNLSVSGGLVTDLLERQVPALESLGVAPDLVTVMIGSNDLLNRRARSTLPRDLAALIERLPSGTVVATMPGGRRGSTDFNRQVTGASHLVTAEFRDPRLRSWKGRVAQDHFHPNDAGYAAMAQVMREAVTAR
ncbi:SGNH/GDSL hydrolase family protein [Aeromicrobium sp. CF3.5]|uniref:SGNH/GDSL hydrolase family protein n=1 Tax=Aeromicrobium sp. CF3.5 TaxID=3373078 RepID=UPI003EE735E7